VFGVAAVAFRRQKKTVGRKSKHQQCCHLSIVQLLGGNVAGVAAAAVDDVAVAVVTANFQLTQSGK